MGMEQIQLQARTPSIFHEPVCGPLLAGFAQREASLARGLLSLLRSTPSTGAYTGRKSVRRPLSGVAGLRRPSSSDGESLLQPHMSFRDRDRYQRPSTRPQTNSRAEP